MTHLTIVIPAYNEKKLIQKSLERILQFLNGKKYGWRIIVVDDGSTDSTSAMVKRVNNNKVDLITHERNMGKGTALRSGVAKVSSKYVIFMDADLSVPLMFVDDMLEKLGTGTPVVVGSRRIENSVIAKHQSFLRENMGVVFNWLTRLVTGVQLNDFTCGFKGFESKAGHKIFGVSVIDRWAYDAEILFLANKMGYTIGQIPVKWTNREDSRVEIGSAAVVAFIDLIRIRVNDLVGVYEKKK